MFEKLQKVGLRRSFEVQDVRTIVERGGKEAGTALIEDLTGVNLQFEDTLNARVTAQAVVDYITRNPEAIDGDMVVLQALHRADKHINNPKNRWMFVTAEEEEQKTDPNNLSGLSKRDRALAMYTEHVIKAVTPWTRSELIENFQTQLEMTKAGAHSYVHMCKGELGEPAGGLVKSTRGRKLVA